MADRAREDRAAAGGRLGRLVGPERASRWTDRLATAGRLTVNFHPDRISAAGHTVAEGLADEGRYRSQWTTWLSSGGRSARPGGDRQRWERLLFCGAYDDCDPGVVDHPIYGALDLTHDPHGGSPRFGSCYLVLTDDARTRTTLCVGDSHQDPADVGTTTESLSILAGLAEQAERGALLDRGLDLADLEDLLDRRPPTAGPSRRLDGYVEAQVHGGIDLATDVVAIVADPSFRRTDTGAHLEAAADRYRLALRWHGGSELAVAEVPSDFRGPTMPDLARRVAGSSSVVDAAAIGVAARAIPVEPPRTHGDPPSSPAQQLKYLWHSVLALGRDADQDGDLRTSG